MASGHVDYGTPFGRGLGGEATVPESFSITVGSDSSGSGDFSAVTTGYENVYQCINISCSDDTAFHAVVLSRVSDSWAFFWQYFVIGGIFNFPAAAIAAGDTVRITVYNYSEKSLTFVGTVFYVARPV